MRSYNESTGFYWDSYDRLRCGAGTLLGSRAVSKESIVAIFRLDHEIRSLAQREESLSYKAGASKKTIDIEDIVEQKDFDSEIKSTRAQRLKDEYTMFRLVTELPLWLKTQYFDLRLNPTWYMREEMVDDCAGRGGCCSRGCGCCAQRSSSQDTKTRGHCTLKCWCCESFRDQSLTEEDLNSIELDLEKPMDRDSYIRRMTNWYFRPIRIRHKRMNFKFLKWKK